MGEASVEILLDIIEGRGVHRHVDSADRAARGCVRAAAQALIFPREPA